MRLILRFLVKREIISYLVQIYWPTVLTTVVSWISFWMNYECSAARVTVGRSCPHPREELGSSCSQKKKKVDIDSKEEYLEQCVTAQASKQHGTCPASIGPWAQPIPSRETDIGDRGEKKNQGWDLGMLGPKYQNSLFDGYVYECTSHKFRSEIQQ